MFFPFSQQAQTNSPHEKKIGQNLSQIGAYYDFYGQKNLGRQSSGIELSTEQELEKSDAICRSENLGLPCTM